MKIAVFYHSLNPDHGRTPIISIEGVHLGFVRGEVVDAPDLSAALDVANPQPDESVMNTHDISEA